MTYFIGILAFSLQIYCDFSGYSLIAIGSARLFDITIMDNFHSPYLSRSVREFWRRWHISLSTWFRDYLYIPLGGGRVSSLRKAVNVLIVFSISGLWHGADFTFFLWGTLNGLFQVIEGWIQPKISRFENHRAFRLLSTFITFFLITYAWVFFRSESLTQSYQIFTKSLSPNFTSFHFDELLRLGLDLPDSIVLLVSLLILFLVDQWRPMENFGDKLWGEPAWVHLIVFTLLLTGILVFGFYGPAYDAQNFIYAQF